MYINNLLPDVKINKMFLEQISFLGQEIFSFYKYYFLDFI